MFMSDGSGRYESSKSAMFVSILVIIALTKQINFYMMNNATSKPKKLLKETPFFLLLLLLVLLLSFLLLFLSCPTIASVGRMTEDMLLTPYRGERGVIVVDIIINHSLDEVNQEKVK